MQFSPTPLEQKYETDKWSIRSNRSHILNSHCTSSFICNKTRETIKSTIKTDDNNGGSDGGGGTPRKTFDEYFKLKNDIFSKTNLCLFCKYDLILSMAHLPDMTYANNYLQLNHLPSGLILEFNSLDALAPVIIKSYGLPIGLKVSASEAWLRARMNCEYTKNVCNANFDWTFSTDYSGTFRLDGEQQQNKDLREDQPPLLNLLDSNTTERIEMEKLKIQKSILFFDEIELFEDELADHGTAQCSVKIRVHDDSFYILLRFFLRVDRVFVRFFDTRIYHEFDKNYLIRECSQHESTITDLNLPEDSAQALLINPASLFQYVPIKQTKVDKILLPNCKIPTQQS